MMNHQPPAFDLAKFSISRSKVLSWRCRSGIGYSFFAVGVPAEDPLVREAAALAGLAGGIGASSIITWLLNRYDRRHPAVDVDKLVRRIEELNAQVDLSTLADKLDGLNNAVKELAYLHAEAEPASETGVGNGSGHGGTVAPPYIGSAASAATTPTDAEILEKCRAAENAAKFADLFDAGDVHVHHGGEG